MDENRFRQQGLPTPSGQFQQPLAPQQYNGPPQHTTLPPIQGGGSQFFSQGLHGHHGSNAQTPTSSRTPSTSAPSSSSTIPPIQQLRPIQPASTYILPGSAFASSQAPSAAHLNGQHPLPLSNGLHSMNMGFQNQYHASMLPHQQPEPEPVHVVGQQGRRGVLPTHPGRPPPSQAPQLPKKNADNKYECPHCVKTYLHLKHLKRHLLRHTGERPYQCCLCKDTFSRSDILKRHFQKCSIRRGNPTGASHLQHAQSHLRPRRQSGVDANPYLSHMGAPVGHMNTPVSFDSAYNFSSVGMPTMTADSNGYPENIPSMNGQSSLSARTSRSNSLIRPATGVEDHRRSMPSMDFAHNRMSYNGTDMRGMNGLPNGMSHGNNAYGAQQNQNGAGVSGNANHYNSYDQAVSQPEMTQSNNLQPVKSEGEEANFGRPTLPTVDGSSNAQDNANFRWNNSMNTNGAGSMNGNASMNGHASTNGDHGNYM